MEEIKTAEQIQMETITQLREKLATMVDPEEHRKLSKQLEEAMKLLVEKRPAPQQTIVVTKTAKELAHEFLTNKKMTNREYISKALEYREAVIKETGKDPFLDQETDPSEAEKTASILNQVLENAESDVDFRILLNNTMVDDPLIANKFNRKKR